MAGKKIFIEYDIDASDLKIANGETLSLTQQLRILKKELQRGDLKPEQFDILRKKIGDTEDQIAKTTVRSKDFFGVISTLPGPVGAFGSSLLGVVDTLKVFSSFTFKDIKNSLGDVLDDVKEITDNFFGLNNATKEVSDSNKNLSQSSDEASDSLAKEAAEVGNVAGAQKSLVKANDGVVISGLKKQKQYEDLRNAEIKLIESGYDYVTVTKKVDGEITGINAKITDLNGNTKEYTNKQIAALGASKQLTKATFDANLGFQQLDKSIRIATIQQNLLTAASTAARFALNALKIALVSLGIGAVILAVTELVSLIGDWVSGTKEAERAQKGFNDELERTNTLLDLDLKAAKRRQDLRVAELKAQGATEEQFQQQSVNALKENLALKQKALEDATDLYNKTLKREDEKALEDLKTIGKRQLDLDQEVKDLRNQIKIAELQDDIKAAEKKKEQQKAANDKLLQQQKEYQQKRVNDAKTAADLEIQLTRENNVLKLKTERERQDQELINQKLAEQDKIKALLIDKNILEKLLAQVDEKYKSKQSDVDKKRKEEDLKLEKDFTRKKQDIEVAAIEDKRERENKEREYKRDRDIEDLEEDKYFIKLSEEEKEKIRQNIRIAYANETREITKSRDKEDRDDRLKALDDELRFLQIRQDAIRAGTKAFYDGQREILNAAQKREIELAEGKEKEITAIKEKYAKLRSDIDKEEFNQYLSYAQAVLTAASNFANNISEINNLQQQIDIQNLKENVKDTEKFAEEEDKIKEKYFYKNQKTQVAQATIGYLQAAIQAYQSLSVIPVVGPALGAAAAAAAILFGVKKVNLIKQQKYQSDVQGGGGASGNGMGRGYADGGLVTGPGGPKSDSIPARLSNGEAVMTSGAVTMFAPLLSMMNQMGGGASFTNSVTSSTLPDKPAVSNPSMEPMIMKTYVVESELTSSQQRQARLKDLSTL